MYEYSALNSFQLEDALHASAQDLKYASSTIQADLDRFQRQKVADIREMSISMARIHRDWCKKVRRCFILEYRYFLSPNPQLKNLEAWIEAKKEIEKIEPHPNQPPPDFLKSRNDETTPQLPTSPLTPA